MLGIGVGGRCIVRHAGVQQPSITPVTASVIHLQHSDVDPLWSSLPATFSVVRYEGVSLPVPLNQELERVAWGTNGEVLAVKVRNKLQWGLFFQPGAHGGEQSKELIRNFYTATLCKKTGKPAQQLEWILPPKVLVGQYVHGAIPLSLWQTNLNAYLPAQLDQDSLQSAVQRLHY